MPDGLADRSMLLFLLACSSPAPTSDPTPAGPAPATPKKIEVALNWFPEPEFGGFYDAVVTGKYQEKNLDVTIIPGGPGTPVMEMLAAGRVEVAVGGAEDLLLRRAKGLDAVAIFPGFQDSPIGLLVHAESGIKTFADIARHPGTRVAIEPGSAFQQYLWSSQKWDGVVPMVPTSGSIGPFASDPNLAQQGYVTSEPCLARAKGLAVEFLPARDAGWNPYESLVVVRGADKDAPWVAAFRDASKAGWAHYLEDPAPANAEISRINPDMPPDRIGCVTEAQRTYVTGTDGLGVMTAARWTALAEELNATGQKVDATGAWVP